jgi:glucose/arabinose dehydrogenase
MSRRAVAALLAAAIVGVGGGCGASTGSSAQATASAPSVPVTTAATTTVAPDATAGSGPTSGGATTSGKTTTPATRSAPVPTGCALPAQGPPGGTIPANFATALAFAPDGRLFYAERAGTVQVFQGGQARVFATVSTVTSEAGGGYSERGLLGLAISPSFTADHYVFAFYSDADHVHSDVIRWVDCAGAATSPAIIIRLPSGADCCHKGGRLAFGPDGKLYVTLGEEHMATVAQDSADVRGKILRYNPDGTVPSDNPFGPGDPVWAFGFRNPFGIAFSASGQLAVTNNGPSGEVAGGPPTGYDTVVAAVSRGGGYQWPNCYGYSHPLLSPSCGNGQHEPDWSSEARTVVPTGATFVDAAGPAGYAGHLVFCTFQSGMQILSPGSPHAAVAAGPAECQLDVKQGPDHALYYSDPLHLYRLA